MSLKVKVEISWSVLFACYKGAAVHLVVVKVFHKGREPKGVDSACSCAFIICRFGF